MSMYEYDEGHFIHIAPYDRPNNKGRLQCRAIVIGPEAWGRYPGHGAPAHLVKDKWLCLVYDEEHGRHEHGLHCYKVVAEFDTREEAMGWAGVISKLEDA